MSFGPTDPIPKAIRALINATVDFANGGPASDLALLWAAARRAIENEIAEAAEKAVAATLRAQVKRYREALTELAIEHWNSTGYCRRCQVHAGHSADCSIVVARKALNGGAHG